MGFASNDVDPWTSWRVIFFSEQDGHQPIIVKIIYYHYRDLVWYYKDKMKKKRNSAGKSIIVD